MRGLIVASIVLLAGIAFGGAGAEAAGSATPQTAASNLSSQSSRTKRARTRVRVTPAGRLMRQCEFHLAREVRASGTYIVPREHCWWARR